MGRAGLILAQQLGMRLIGFDLSPASIAVARSSAHEAGLDGHVTFQVGDVVATGLKDGVCAAVVSLDVLLYLSDKPRAISEAARILSPGGLYAFTTWEQSGFSERLGSKQIADHHSLLTAANFDVEVY